MKFVLTQAVCREGMEMLEHVSSVYVADSTDLSVCPEQMLDADALIVRIGQCTEKTIADSPSLKVIGRTGVGYDSVDVKVATSRGIPVIITPGANNRSVAEHSVAMMFALSKNLYEAQKEMCSGNWKIRDAKKAFELEGKTVGVIGMGAIGREVAKICLGCGMNIAAYDPFLTREKIEALHADYYADYEELLKVSDIVTVHVPLTAATQNMIAKPQLESMKKTSLIINCSRGGIVNEADLADALKNGTIAGAGVDVFCEEPPQADHPLLNCPNIVVSPHSAAQTREAVFKMADMCIRGCLATLEGKKWPYVADPDVYKHPKWENAEWA